MKNDTKRTSGVRVPPPITFAVFFIAGWSLNFLYYISLTIGLLEALVGIFLVVFSFPLAIWATLVMKKKQTPVSIFQPTTEIVQTGPFRYVRNPIYLSLVILYLGLGLWLELVWPLLLLPIAILTVHYRVILKEERYLEVRFGEQYLAYKKKVRRWGVL